MIWLSGHPPCHTADARSSARMPRREDAHRLRNAASGGFGTQPSLQRLPFAAPNRAEECFLRQAQWRWTRLYVSLQRAVVCLYFRGEQFAETVRNVSADVAYLFQTQSLPLPITASGTGLMEMAVTNLLDPGDRAIVLNGGTFGQRWTDICTVSELKPQLGRSPDMDMLDGMLTAGAPSGEYVGIAKLGKEFAPVPLDELAHPGKVTFAAATWSYRARAIRELDSVHGGKRHCRERLHGSYRICGLARMAYCADAGSGSEDMAGFGGHKSVGVRPDSRRCSVSTGSPHGGSRQLSDGAASSVRGPCPSVSR